MDSHQVVARFEAERQALAMMDHQNIARALDAAITESGRPYFVMELVHGVPITRFCDDNKLTPRERLANEILYCLVPTLQRGNPLSGRSASPRFPSRGAASCRRGASKRTFPRGSVGTRTEPSLAFSLSLFQRYWG